MSFQELPIQNIKPTSTHMWQKGIFQICKLILTSFSTTERRRSSPNHPSKSQHVLLVTIGPSHYCEKARWALDILEQDPASPIYYTENAHPPLFQSMETLHISKGVASMVPMVAMDPVTDSVLNHRRDISSSSKEQGSRVATNTAVLYDSSRIVQYFCPFLYPESCKDEIIELEEYFGNHIGATARCYLYHVMLTPKYYPVLSKLLTAQSSTVEKKVWSKLLDKGLADGMKKAMGVDEVSAQNSLVALREAFANVSNRLRQKDGSKKKYLMMKDDDNDDDDNGNKGNDRLDIGFTAADLAFASLASIIIMPPELKCFMPMEESQVPDELRTLRDELRSTLAGQHVLEMYRNVRGVVVPKVVNRDCLIPWSMITIGACVGAGMVYAKL